jgi:hypothetical protein
MVDLATLRRLALGLPEAHDASDGDRLAFEVRGKGFAWTYMERVEPKTPRRLRPDVLAVRCPRETKDMLLEAAPDRFFDDDHYRGYPAVLVRLAAIDADEMAGLLRGGWRAVAPRALVKAADAEN